MALAASLSERSFSLSEMVKRADLHQISLGTIDKEQNRLRKNACVAETFTALVQTNDPGDTPVFYAIRGFSCVTFARAAP